MTELLNSPVIATTVGALITAATSWLIHRNRRRDDQDDPSR